MTAAPHLSGTSRRAGRSSELWLVDRAGLAPVLSEREAATPRLSPEEVARAAAMRDHGAATIWAAGRIALRILIEEWRGPEIARRSFTVAPGGRPYIDGSNIAFSQADSGPYMIVALDTIAPIGVDIELPRRLVMSPPRIACICAAGNGLGDENVGDAIDPLVAWTRIEAFAKALGPTLAATLALLGIQGHGEGVISTEAVHARSRHARLDAGLAVQDIALPNELVGSVVRKPGPTDSRAAPRLQILDFSMIDRLARQ